MNDERERTVAGDARRRVIADCAALLPLARSACGAMDEGDEAEVLRLFCGESQKQTLRRLGRLIDDLRLCRTVADLPGPEPEVIELRNASFRVFRGLSARAGNPLNLAKRFRSGAVDFFRMLVRQDPMLLQLVHRGPWRRFAYDLLFAALKANQYLLQLRQVPSALLRPLLRRKRGRFHGERDKTLHSVRAQVIAEMRRRRKSTGLPWPRIVTALRNNSAYSARLRDKSDATWIRYAKSGFSG